MQHAPQEPVAQPHTRVEHAYGQRAAALRMHIRAYRAASPLPKARKGLWRERHRQAEAGLAVACLSRLPPLIVLILSTTLLLLLLLGVIGVVLFTLVLRAKIIVTLCLKRKVEVTLIAAGEFVGLLPLPLMVLVLLNCVEDGHGAVTSLPLLQDVHLQLALPPALPPPPPLLLRHALRCESVIRSLLR